MVPNLAETEKCGVFGIVGPQISTFEIYTLSLALKHRGNGPSGYAAVETDGTTTTDTADNIDDLPIIGKSLKTSVVAIGHGRYATSGGKETTATTEAKNTQPFVLTENGFTLGLGHNGNIPEAVVAQLRPKLHKELPASASDSAILAQFLIEARNQFPNWTETFIQVLPLFKGAFSLTCFTDEGYLYAIRDPAGIRPLCIGWKDGQWIAASESVALDALNAEYIREVKPGEILCLKPDGSSRSITYALGPEQPCSLEEIYFARKASFNGQDLIEHHRENLGRAAARRFKAKNIPIDWVVPILNSGSSVAVGAATELGVPLYEAIGINGDTRSFIQNTQDKRDQAVYEKHVVFDPKHAGEIAGKSVLFCDDSAVRGTSLKGLVRKIQALKENGPSHIHVLLGSEPVSDLCDLGVDLPNKKDLLVNQFNSTDLTDIELQVAEFLGVDSVTYLDRSGMEFALDRPSDEMCYACFGGPHPIRDRQPPVFRSKQTKKLKAQKVLFMASGAGTNVAEVLHQMEIGTVLAQPAGIITNKSDAGVISIAQEHKIPITVVPSVGRRKTETDKTQYESDLLAAILTGTKDLPDVIVLAGWMLILSDEFVQKLTNLNIQIINLHPALLSGKGQATVVTSQGPIPEIRGGHAIAETTAKTITEMPVTGATVHRVLPAGEVDTGKVIIKEEVLRHKEESAEELENRIHTAEHRILSIALQRVLMAQLAEA